MSSRRVVVTGMGLVTPLGNDVPSTWAGMVEGRSGVSTIDAFDPSRLSVRFAGQVHDFEPGITASGLFWTTRVHDATADIRAGRGRASFTKGAAPWRLQSNRS